MIRMLGHHELRLTAYTNNMDPRCDDEISIVGARGVAK